MGMRKFVEKETNKVNNRTEYKLHFIKEENFDRQKY